MSAGTTQIIFLVVIVAAFYFLIIRPQQQRSKQQQEMMSSLTPGAEIMTIGGMYATIVSIEDDRVLVELYDGTRLELAKRAVAQVLSAKAEHEEEDVDSEPEMAETSSGDTAASGESSDSDGPAEKDAAVPAADAGFTTPAQKDDSQE